MHDGRTLGSDTVTFSQDDRIMSRGLILWGTDEPDLIRHLEHVEMPDVPSPEEVNVNPGGLVFPGAEARIVDDIDVWSEDQPVGLRTPAHLDPFRHELLPGREPGHRVVGN